MGLQPTQVKTKHATETTQQKAHQLRQEREEGGQDSTVMISRTDSGESRKEARALKSQLLTAKSRTKIGSWNVRTLYSTGKLAQVINEMKHYQLDILGISEMRWTDSGRIESDGMAIYYSGGTKHEKGVGIILTKEMAKSVIAWEPASERIIMVRIETRYTKVTLIQVYAPTNAAEDQEKDEFYELLQDVLDATPEHDMKIIMGDFNAQIGRDNTGWDTGQRGNWSQK